MAFDLEKQASLARDGTFRQRVTMALGMYADDVMAENQAAMTGVDYNGTTEKAARTVLATRVINDAVGVADRVKWFLAAQAGESALTWNDPTTAAEFADSIPDATYATFISANWSMLAGWREAD